MIDHLNIKKFTITLRGLKQDLLTIEISDACLPKLESTMVNSVRDYHNIIFMLSLVKG